MILFLYNAALLVALVVSLPWWLWRVVTTEKYREGLAERLGRVKRLKTGGKPVIWVHAVSVGEVLAVGRLVAELDAALPGYCVAVSTTTRTGQAVARQRFGAERVFYCPLDLLWAVAARLKSLRPEMLVLAETEFWPNLLVGCFRRQIPVVVVNARISDRSWPRYSRLRGLWRPFLSRLTRVLAQTELDAERLRALGCGHVTVAGNLKFDVRANLAPGGRESAAMELLQGLGGGLRFVVAGSTLEGEEAALVDAWPRVLEADGGSGSGPRAGLVMVMAVRHPERFGAVAALLDGAGVRWRRRSEMGPGSEMLAAGEIVLLDSLGELASVYSLAAVAFVGGSVAAAGGHNPLEPAQFGVPVVMGPHYENFRGIVEAMRTAGGIRIVEAGASGLAEGLAALLADGRMAAEIGERGRSVFLAEGGATGRVVEAIRKALPVPVQGGRVYLAIVDQATRIHRNAEGDEAVFSFLRKNGMGQIQSIRIFAGLSGCSLGAAKDRLHESAAWSDQREVTERIWGEFFAVLGEESASSSVGGNSGGSSQVSVDEGGAR